MPTKTTLKIKQIAEVALVVSDLERSRIFYSEVLGLEEFKYEKLVPGTGLTFHLGNGYLGLWLPGEGKIEDLGHRAHVVLYIDPADEDKALNTLRNHNVKYWGPRYNEGHEVHIDFEDPDGHMLEFWGRKLHVDSPSFQSPNSLPTMHPRQFLL
jgi:catechol 2,3-dioxygenase-like lactoylglutathione lyase family enzyme